MIENLGYATDLMVLGDDAVVRPEGDGTLVVLPRNPRFFWGNFLLLPAPPSPADIPATIARFEALVAHEPQIEHVAIGWHDPTGDAPAIAAFEALGFKPERGVVLVSAGEVVSPPGTKTLADLEIRAPEGDADWEALTQMQLDSSPLPFPRAFREKYRRTRNATLRKAIEAGRAIWRCAYLDGQVVGSMGLFGGADGLGRFQSVQTHPNFRRRGICSALLCATAAAGRAVLGAQRLVIVADSGAPAEAIYLSHGFAAHTPTHGVCRYPTLQSDAPT